MVEWSSYRLRDFMLFSRETLLETYRGYNLDYWPWQGLTILAIVVAGFLLRRPSRLRLRLVLLSMAAAWTWVALVFHLHYFEPINWAARYFAYAFLLQALLLALFGGSLAFGLRSALPGFWRSLGLVVFLFVSLFPIELFTQLDLEISHVLIFGWGAERTALGTLVVTLLLLRGRIRWLLAIIPLLWVTLSFLAYTAMA